jgi:SAM-dependent methyltransferase
MADYLDMQAELGISKHQGGFPATKRLLELCHVERAAEVLDAGCGIGVGPAYIARTYGCRVAGVDRSPRMIEWSRDRARWDGVEHLVELRVADLRELPFETDRFDVVVAESVLAFVDDKAQAIRELVRVTKPGGYVGLNELVAVEEIPEDVAQVARDLGTQVLSAADWRALWDGSGLGDRVIRIHRIDPVVEVRSRIRWMGLRWLARAWTRAAWLLATRRDLRDSVRTVMGGAKALDAWAYALLVGRK